MTSARDSVQRMTLANRVLARIRSVTRASSPGHDEAAALAHVLVELQEIADVLGGRVTAIIEQGDELPTTDLEEELDEIQEGLRHLLILIPLTKRYGHLLPDDEPIPEPRNAPDQRQTP